MRFEAKHNYFKKLVDKINNFKNITYSLAKRHQALQAYLLQASAGNFLRMSLEVGQGNGNRPQAVGHFTVVYCAAWSLGGSEADSDLDLTETFVLFKCKSNLFNI